MFGNYEKVFFNYIEKYINERDIDLDTFDRYDGGDYDFAEAVDFYYNFGATKGCFTPVEVSNFVFKFDFASNVSNYCIAEVENYKAAKKIGLGDVFTRIDYFGHLNGTPIYICERVTNTHGEHYSPVYTREHMYKFLMKTVKSDCTYKLPISWVKDFIDYHGAKKYFDFLKFVKKMGINDLHGGNVGYIGFRPVVFDYSGYYEESDEW